MIELQTLGKTKKTIMDIKLTLVEEIGLDNITTLLIAVKEQGIKGAFVEAGVWRGGTAIWARANMDYLGIDEPVIACDSFKGLPPPDPKYPIDKEDTHYAVPELAVSLHTVMENFSYFPLKGKTIFVEGWFKDTMPRLSEDFGSICILRVDADMYESTIQVLEGLYDKISAGGYVILDDYSLPGAKAAIDDFRNKHKIKNPLIKVNSSIYFWKKDRVGNNSKLSEEELNKMSLVGYRVHI